MAKLEFGTLIDSGAISVTQNIRLYMDSFARQPIYEGKTPGLPDGYRTFTVDGIEPDQDVLKLRIKLTI